jgi:hypothetical protein
MRINIIVVLKECLLPGHRKHTAKIAVVILATMLFTLDLLQEYLPLNIWGDMAKTLLHSPIGKWAGLLGMLAVFLEEQHNNRNDPPPPPMVMNWPF